MEIYKYRHTGSYIKPHHCCTNSFSMLFKNTLLTAPLRSNLVMAKRFRLRISRVIPSFQSCRSKDPCTLPANPVPSFLRPSPSPSLNNNLLTPQPPSKSHHSSSIKRHVSAAFGCGLGKKPTLSDDDRSGSLPPEVFEWEREDKWHVVAMVNEDKTPRRKIYTSSVSAESERDDGFSFSLSPPPPPPPSSAEKKKKQRERERESFCRKKREEEEERKRGKREKEKLIN